MQCMRKPHERLIIWMMLVSEDNASRKKKKKKVKKLHSALFYLAAGGLLLTHHNGVKVYFNKHTVWEAGKLASLATPGATLFKQPVAPHWYPLSDSQKSFKFHSAHGSDVPALMALGAHGRQGTSLGEAPLWKELFAFREELKCVLFLFLVQTFTSIFVKIQMQQVAWVVHLATRSLSPQVRVQR